MTIHFNFHSKTKLYLLALLAMIGSIGVALPYPIFAPMLLHANSTHTFLALQSHHATPSVILGALLAVYPLGLFLGSPILGNLSDHYGRKKLIICSLLCASVGYALSVYALWMHSLILLLFSRFFTGFVEGNVSVFRSAAADIPELNKYQAFGFVSTGITLGYTIGPLLGGVLSNPHICSWFNYYLPFALGAFITMLGAVIAWIILDETAKNKPKEHSLYFQIKQHINIIRQLRYLCQNPRLQLLFTASFCFWFGVDSYYEFYPVFLVKAWAMNTTGIALLTAVMSLGIALGASWCSRLLSDLFSSRTIFLTHIMLYIMMLILTLTVSKLFMLYLVFTLTGIFIAVVSNLFNVKISDVADIEHRGVALGMATGLRMLGDATLSFVGGFLIIISPAVPLLCAIGVASVAIYLVTKGKI